MAWTNMGTKALGYNIGTTEWDQLVGNMDIHQTWTNFVPTLTATSNPTLSDNASHTIVGHYWSVGDDTAGGLCIIQILIAFGNSGVASGSGDYKIGNLPYSVVDGNSTSVVAGQGRIYDNSATLYRLVTAYFPSPAVLKMITDNTTNEVGAAVPWTWAGSDSIRLSLIYRI